MDKLLPARNIRVLPEILLPVFCLAALGARADEAGGSWKKHVVLSAEETGGGVNTVLANDFDGDGKLDVASVDEGSRDVAIYQQAAQTPLRNEAQTLAALPAGTRPSSFTVADLDADGDLDLAIAFKPALEARRHFTELQTGAVYHATGDRPDQVAADHLDGSEQDAGEALRLLLTSVRSS